MYEKNLWNEKFDQSTYLYGTEANTFLADHAHMMAGPVLSLAEGEGRNAVFLASLGLQVLGVDCSDVGLQKALKLAESRGVTIQTEQVDLATFNPAENHYSSVVSIFAHLPKVVRDTLYPQIERALKPNGIVVLEAYTEAQLAKSTGGPKDVDMLMSCEKIAQEFPNLTPVLCREIERDVVEGDGHTGLASVVQFIGKKE